MHSSLSWPLPTLFFNQFPSSSSATHHRYACSSRSTSISLSSQSFSASSSHGLCSPPSSSSFNLDRTPSSSSSTRVARIRCSNSPNTWTSGGVSSQPALGKWAEAVGEVLSVAFPIWVSLGCLLGLAKPSAFGWVQPRWMTLGMTLNMLGMGMTLTLDDLRGAFSLTRELITGFVLQYSVMPLSGYLVSKLLQLPSCYAVGLILTACCPGGLASNIVTYIARGNVALSVLMTAASTILAVVMTPFLTATLAGHYVSVSATGLMISTLQVVLIPVLAGAFLNQYYKGLVKICSPLMPPIAVATVALMNGNAIAQSSSSILKSGQQVALASCLLHALGFAFGFLLPRLLGVNESSSRTISIEVGMQNTSLGVVLAGQHFGSPMAAVPCAISGICQSIFGSALAGLWRRSVPNKTSD